jgi:hypothetical protein
MITQGKCRNPDSKGSFFLRSEVLPHPDLRKEEPSVPAYAAIPPDDPFAASKGLLDALACELAGPAAAGLTASGLEELLDERGREIMRQLLQDHYSLRAVREEQQARAHPAPVTGPGQITRTRLETGHSRSLATLSGTVTVTRCAWRKPGAPNYSPADAALSLPAGLHSRTLEKLAAIEAARGSFDGAHAAITRRCGNVIGKRQAGESVVHERPGGRAAAAGRDGGHPARRRPRRIHAATIASLTTIKLADLDLASATLTVKNRHKQRVIYLDDVTLEVLSRWLRYRHGRWPASPNPHLFVTQQTAVGTAPVSSTWFWILFEPLRVHPESLRQDRILDEARHTADPVHLIRVFGISDTTALKYVHAAHPGRQSVIPR